MGPTEFYWEILWLNFLSICTCVLFKFCFKALCRLCFMPYQLVFKMSRLILTWASEGAPRGGMWSLGVSLCVVTVLCLSLEPPQSGASEINSQFSCDSQGRIWCLCPGLGSVLALHSVQALLALFAWDFTIWQCHLEGINKAIVSGVLSGVPYIFLVRKYRIKDPAEITKNIAATVRKW